MTNKSLHHLGINRNDYKKEIDKMVEDTANQILNATTKGKTKGGAVNFLGGQPNVLAGGPNYLAGGKKKGSKKAPKAKKPRSAKQLKRDKLMKWCRQKGMTMKASNAFIKKHDLMNKDISF